MKKTVYLVSERHENHMVKSAIENVNAKKEEFIEKNRSLIGEIDTEQLILNSHPNPNVSQFFAVIQLTYFPKK